jgi:hypothetical protein
VLEETMTHFYTRAMVLKSNGGPAEQIGANLREAAAIAQTPPARTCGEDGSSNWSVQPSETGETPMMDWQKLQDRLAVSSRLEF